MVNKTMREFGIGCGKDMDKFWKDFHCLCSQPLPTPTKSRPTPATCPNLLYFQKFRIYFCVRIDIDAQLLK
jgi:hypothetical protein